MAPTKTTTDGFPDWRPAPNIGQHPEIYQLENEAIARDGRLDAALRQLCDWKGKTLLDIGCGTGFWLPRYAEHARRVIGVEPDPGLRERASNRTAAGRVEVLAGSAEQLPLEENSVDIAHARFAYFFGEGAEAGLDEARRVLKPGGSFVAVDNGWNGGDFAWLLGIATAGNATIDPESTSRWWDAQGAERVDVRAGWECRSPDELESILRIEFADEVVDRFFDERHDGTARITYEYTLFHLTLD